MVSHSVPLHFFARTPNETPFVLDGVRKLFAQVFRK